MGETEMKIEEALKRMLQWGKPAFELGTYDAAAHRGDFQAWMAGQMRVLVACSEVRPASQNSVPEPTA